MTKPPQCPTCSNFLKTLSYRTLKRRANPIEGLIIRDNRVRVQKQSTHTSIYKSFPYLYYCPTCDILVPRGTRTKRDIMQKLRKLPQKILRRTITPYMLRRRAARREKIKELKEIFDFVCDVCVPPVGFVNNKEYGVHKSKSKKHKHYVRQLERQRAEDRDFLTPPATSKMDEVIIDN